MFCGARDPRWLGLGGYVLLGPGVDRERRGERSRLSDKDRCPLDTGPCVEGRDGWRPTQLGEHCGPPSALACPGRCGNGIHPARCRPKRWPPPVIERIWAFAAPPYRSLGAVNVW